MLFGTPEILRDGEPVAISRRKSRALFYYVAANTRPQQREQLLNLFWPDTNRVAAQQVLRTTLHGLRKELGEYLVVERDSVYLEQSVQVDARMFERNLAVQSTDTLKLETILELYRGPFLDGFNAGENVEFEQWMMAERERYQRMAVRGMVSLSRYHAAVGDYAAALRTLERGLALDPLQEDLQRETIRFAYLSGDRAGAIRRYDQLRRLLDEELGVPPMAETRSLYDQILDDSLPTPVPAAVQIPTMSAKSAIGRQEGGFLLPFRSREDELQILQTELFGGRLLLVEGEPGIGKTRLVEHFLSNQTGVVCLRGAGRELESNLPYQPVVEALRSLRSQPEGEEIINRVRRSLPAVWLGEAARLIPELGEGSSATADEWRLWEGVHQFLRAVSGQRPVAIFLDDLQWADSSSLGLLGYLIRNLTQNGAIGFVAASHLPASGSPLNGLITALRRNDRIRRIPLRRFNPQEVSDVVAGLVGPAEPLATWLYERTEGNLYILAEFVRQARQNGWLERKTAPPPEATQDVSGDLYGLIQSGLSRLTDAGRRILDTAVAVGRDFDFDLVARASGLSEDAALDGLDELLAAGLVHATGPSTVYRFDHSLVMEVAYREVGEARHRQSHRQIAAAMKQLYRQHPPKNLDGLLAFHYMEGNEPERAAPYAFKAGITSVALAAWQQAAVFFEQALQGTEGQAQYPILMQLGQAQARGGAFTQALESFQQALDLALDAHSRAEIDAARLQLAQAYLPLARFEDVITQTRTVLEQGLPENAMFAELWWGTALSLEGADLQGAGEHLNRAAQVSRENGPRESLAQVEFELGTLWAQRGDLPQAVSHYYEALRVAEEADTPVLIERRTLAHNNLAYHLLLMNDPRAEEHARLGMELAQEKGLLGLQTYLYSTMGEIALSRGEWDRAQDLFAQGLDLAQRLAIPERVAGLSANLGLVERARGNADKAVEWLTSARAMADELGLRQLSAQIRIWIAPLLSYEEGLAQLDEARAIAEHGGRMRLLEEEQRVRRELKK